MLFFSQELITFFMGPTRHVRMLSDTLTLEKFFASQGQKLIRDFRNGDIFYSIVEDSSIVEQKPEKSLVIFGAFLEENWQKTGRLPQELKETSNEELLAWAEEHNLEIGIDAYGETTTGDPSLIIYSCREKGWQSKSKDGLAYRGTLLQDYLKRVKPNNSTE